MANFVIKADPAKDLYVLWSEIAHCPLRWGTAAQLKLSPSQQDEIDMVGTSSVKGYGAWGCGPMRLDNVGESNKWALPRNNVAAFLRDLTLCDDETTVLEKHAIAVLPEGVQH